MKDFMVYVNSKFMVKVEAESNLEAEHIVLELDGCNTALAFNLEDKDECSTETFRACMRFSDFVSMAALVNMSKALTEAIAEKREVAIKMNALVVEMEEIDKAIFELQERRNAVRKRWAAMGDDELTDAIMAESAAKSNLCSNLR